MSHGGQGGGKGGYKNLLKVYVGGVYAGLKGNAMNKFLHDHGQPSSNCWVTRE